MLDRETQKQMQAEQKFLGISNGLKTHSPAPFGGMNHQSTARQGMEDSEFWWRENFIKTSPMCLRTLWDQGSPLYTAPAGKTIVHFFFFNIGAANYVTIFLSDGTAVQVNVASLAQTPISSTPSTFYAGGQLPACAQSGAQYLLIANNITSNSYWIWDGAVLYSAGSLGATVTLLSGGSGYSSAPTVTAYGGSGSGAAFTATVNAGAVVAVHVTNPGYGYVPGETVQLQFSGGGSDTGAILLASLASNVVSHITLLAGGSGYVAPAVAITGGGSGATATATQVGGIITAITVTSPGSGYTSTPTVAISDASGTGAQAQALLNQGGVASITVVNGGSGFNVTPLLTIVGGGGSGATATASVSGGAITAVTVTAPGTGFTSIPAVEVNTGVNNAAAATATLMPFGVSGSSIETYQSRVWLPYPNQQGSQVNGGTFLLSAPGSLTDFSPADGGLIYTSTDSFLRAQYTNIKQSNGYLYPIGDSSVSVISSVQTGGNPVTTAFNYQNTDPQIGTSWRDSLQAFSRTIIFANAFGVFGLYGGAVTKISQKMDEIFNKAVFTGSGVTPTSAVANIFNMKVYLLNMTVTDPFTDSPRTVMLGWDEKEWFIASQASAYTVIGTQEINSNMAAWGTDGSSLYPLFNRPSALITKKLSTKLYGHDNFLIQKEAMGVYAQVQDLSPAQSGVAFSGLTVDAEHGTYAVPTIPTFPACPPPYYAVESAGSGDVTGINLGMTLTSNSLDFSVNYLGFGYVEVGSIALSSTPISGTINTE